MNSGSFGEFMQQVPAGIWLMLTMSAIMLAIIAVVLVYLRVRRSGVAPASPVMRAAAATQSASSSDFPALDDLLNLGASAAPVPVRQPQLVDVRINNEFPVRAAEILVVLRDVTSGQLIVQIGEDAYTASGKVGVAFTEKLRRVMQELAQYSQAVESHVPVAGAAPGDVAELPSLYDMAAFTPEKTASGASSATLNATPDMTKPLDLVGQIEALLQRRLFATELRGRDIHIVPGRDGGVSIRVDGHIFESVDDVTDATVRQFIADTIQEWQSQN